MIKQGGGLLGPRRTMAEQEEQIYTIDELAAATGVSSRTIRFYQSKGALPPPQRRGRKAYYGEPHIKRLELIAKLQDRGLQIRAIRNLCERLDGGQSSLEGWLGFEAQLRSPWSGDSPQLLGEEEMQARLADRPPGLLGALLHANLVERQSDRYLVRSPALLTMALTLEENGIGVDAAQEASLILTRHLSKAAAELSRYFNEEVDMRAVDEEGPEALGQLVQNLGPVALDAAKVIFAREMQRVMEQMLTEGQVGLLGRPQRGKREPDER